MSYTIHDAYDGGPNSRRWGPTAPSGSGAGAFRHLTGISRTLSPKSAVAARPPSQERQANNDYRRHADMHRHQQHQQYPYQQQQYYHMYGGGGDMMVAGDVPPPGLSGYSPLSAYQQQQQQQAMAAVAAYASYYSQPFYGGAASTTTTTATTTTSKQQQQHQKAAMAAAAAVAATAAAGHMPGVGGSDGGASAVEADLFQRYYEYYATVQHRYYQQQLQVQQYQQLHGMSPERNEEEDDGGGYPYYSHYQGGVGGRARYNPQQQQSPSGRSRSSSSNSRPATLATWLPPHLRAIRLPSHQQQQQQGDLTANGAYAAATPAEERIGAWDPSAAGCPRRGSWFNWTLEGAADGAGQQQPGTSPAPITAITTAAAAYGQVPTCTPPEPLALSPSQRHGQAPTANTTAARHLANRNNDHDSINDSTTTTTAAAVLTPSNITAYAATHCLLCGHGGHGYTDCGGFDPSMVCLFNAHDSGVYVMRRGDWATGATLADVVNHVESAMHLPRSACELWVDGRSLAALAGQGKSSMALPPRKLRMRCCQLRLLPGAVVFVASAGVWGPRVAAEAAAAAAAAVAVAVGESHGARVMSCKHRIVTHNEKEEEGGGGGGSSAPVADNAINDNTAGQQQLPPRLLLSPRVGPQPHPQVNMSHDSALGETGPRLEDLSIITAATPSKMRSLPMPTLASAATASEGKPTTTTAVTVFPATHRRPEREATVLVPLPEESDTTAATADDSSAAATRLGLEELLSPPLHPAAAAAAAQTDHERDVEQRRRAAWGPERGGGFTDTYETTAVRQVRTLHVKYVPIEMSFLQIRLLFAQFGQLRRVRVICPSGFSSPSPSTRCADQRGRFNVAFVEYSCRAEAIIAHEYLRDCDCNNAFGGGGGAGGMTLAAQWARQAITGGYRTDCDGPTGKPCTFGLTQEEISAVNTRYKFVFPGGAEAGEGARARGRRSATAAVLRAQAASSDTAAVPASPDGNCTATTATTTATATPTAATTAAAVGPIIVSAANVAVLDAGVLRRRAAAVASFFLHRHYHGRVFPAVPTAMVGDGGGTTTTTAVATTDGHRWSAGQLVALAGLRSRMRESAATYATRAVEPAFHQTLDTIARLLTFPGVRNSSTAEETETVTAITVSLGNINTEEEGEVVAVIAHHPRSHLHQQPHPLLLLVEVHTCEAALYVHHDGHGDGRRAARAAQLALAAVHRYAKDLGQLHLLLGGIADRAAAGTGGGGAVDVTGGDAHTMQGRRFAALSAVLSPHYSYTPLSPAPKPSPVPRSDQLFTSVAITRQFSRAGMRSALRDCTLLPIDGDCNNNDGNGCGKDDDDDDDEHSVAPSTAATTAARMSVPYPRLDVCYFLIERLIQMALVLDNYIATGTDVQQYTREMNTSVGTIPGGNGGDRAEDGAANHHQQQQQQHQQWGTECRPAPHCAAVPVASVSPLVLPVGRHAYDASRGLNPVHNSSSSSSSSSSSIKEGEDAAGLAVAGADCYRDVEDLRFIERVKVELVSVAVQLYQHLLDISASAVLVAALQLSMRADFGITTGSDGTYADAVTVDEPAAVSEQQPQCLAVAGIMDRCSDCSSNDTTTTTTTTEAADSGEAAAAATAAKQEEEEAAAAALFWAALHRLVADRLPSCATIAGSHKGSSNTSVSNTSGSLNNSTSGGGSRRGLPCAGSSASSSPMAVVDRAGALLERLVPAKGGRRYPATLLTSIGASGILDQV